MIRRIFLGHLGEQVGLDIFNEKRRVRSNLSKPAHPTARTCLG